MRETSPFVRHVGRICGACAARTAVRDAAGSLTYEELWRAAGVVAAGLVEGGLGGSRIGLLTRAGTPWPVAFLGILRAGGTAVALSPLHPAPELRWFVEASRASALLASEEHLDLASQVAGDRPVLRVEAAGAAGAGPIGPGERPASETALLLYTSGTTGKPKGACLTHQNLLAQALVLGSAWGFTAEDVLLHTLPLHHLHGIGVALLVALSAGAETRFAGKFDASRVWEALSEATVLMGVPTQHRLLMDALDATEALDGEMRRRRVESARRLRLVTSGSAALPPSVGERWRALTGRYPLERYGMTEIGIVLSNPLDGERRPGSVGLPLPGVQIRVVGEGGGDALPEEPGELWVSAPTVFAGYDGDAGATASVRAGEWFRTGDTASRSQDGYVRILGRTSTDILKCGGYKLSALEIEDALREHPAVSDVAVVAMPDATYGEVPVAVVVPVTGRGAEVEGERLRDWARARIAAYKVPRVVVVRPELPRTALGKVQKSVLAQAMAEVIGEARTSPGRPGRA